MDSITGFLVKSKVTNEVKSFTRELGLDGDDNSGADEERKKREAEEAYRKQEIKNEEKMRQIDADHMKKREEREKKRDDIRNKYGIGDGASSNKTPSNTGSKTTSGKSGKSGKSEGGDKCKVS